MHLLQIWILPEAAEPAAVLRADATSARREKRERLRLVASRDGRDGSVVVHQDVALYAGRLAAGAKHRATRWRRAATRGCRSRAASLRLDGETLAAGDGAAVTGSRSLELEALESAHVLVFDLA